MNSFYKFTIIIPHHNIPQLLKRCLKSIPKRGDIQIIVVDDASDAIYKNELIHICAESQIELVQLDMNRGAGYARNVGLGRTKGHWLFFADADDFFLSSFWNEVDSIVDRAQEDIIYFKIDSVDSDTLLPAEREVKDKLNKLVCNFISGRKRSDGYLRILHTSPIGKIFKTSFILNNNIKFEEIIAANDVMFSVISGAKASSIIAVENLMYVATVRKDSMIQQKNRNSRRCRYEVVLRQNLFCVNNGRGYYAEFLFINLLKVLRKYGFSEFKWYIVKMIEYRVNPFWGFQRKWNTKYHME